MPRDGSRRPRNRARRSHHVPTSRRVRHRMPTTSAKLTVDVTVTNSDGKSTTQTSAFTYSVPTLTIDTISPSTVITTGGQQITITGAGFSTALASSVTIGGVAATFNVANPVTLTVTTPAHASGNADVVVKMGNNTATKANGVTYIVFTAPAHRHAARH